MQTTANREKIASSPVPFKHQKRVHAMCIVQTKFPGIVMGLKTIWIGSLGPWSVLLSSINCNSYFPNIYLQNPLPPSHDTSHSSQTIVMV